MPKLVACSENSAYEVLEQVLGGGTTSALGAVVRAAAATRPAETQCAAAEVSTFPASSSGELRGQNQLQTGGQQLWAAN